MGKLFPVLLLLAAALTGCIKEDRSDCFDGVSVVVRIDPASKVNDPVIDDVTLYVFNPSGNLLEIRGTKLEKEELFRYPDEGRLTIISWLNIGCFDCNVTGSSAITLNEGRKTLQANKSMADFNEVPTDLFHGMVVAENKKNSGNIEEKVILASRKVGAMNITVRGLKAHTGYHDDNFSIHVGPTRSAYSFSGAVVTSSDNARHRLISSFEASGEYKIPTFNLMPSAGAQPLISIMHGSTELIHSTDKDNDGELLNIEANKTYNILIEFKGTAIVVTVVETSWGEVHIWEKVFP